MDSNLISSGCNTKSDNVKLNFASHTLYKDAGVLFSSPHHTLLYVAALHQSTRRQVRNIISFNSILRAAPSRYLTGFQTLKCYESVRRAWRTGGYGIDGS